uniref:Putative secreted protein n=1 Tax=Ixodes ricinus TaxID=34613 RepID=A0A6B0U7S7_IXORI
MTLPSCLFLFSFIIVGSTVLPPSSPDVSVSVSSASAHQRGHASSRLRRFTSRRVPVYIIACDSGTHRSSVGHACEGDERERGVSVVKVCYR